MRPKNIMPIKTIDLSVVEVRKFYNRKINTALIKNKNQPLWPHNLKKTYNVQNIM